MTEDTPNRAITAIQAGDRATGKRLLYRSAEGRPRQRRHLGLDVGRLSGNALPY
jgi:hypothetical protein